MEEVRGPSYYDRQLDSMSSLPAEACIRTKMSPVRHTPPLAVGGSTSYSIQTFRTEKGETVFLEISGEGTAQRIMLPPEVTRVILRQHDSLTARARKRGAAQAVITREQKGIVPFAKKGRR